MLSPYKVLDATDERGQLAGAMLASLGADVVLIEPPGGSRSRRCPPFVSNDAVAGESRESLSHWSANRGKRSVVLDLESSSADRDVFVELVIGADVLIDVDQHGALAACGLGPDELAALNPGLVHATITPFGLDGPKASWPATDLTVWASAMVLTVTGDEDRPPVRPSIPQAFFHAAGEAATAIIVALLERGRSGRGQRIDVSAQQACLLATQSQVLAAAFDAPEPRRSSGGLWAGPLHLQMAWPCKDGHVAVTFLFGEAIGPFTARLMSWVHDEGFCDLATSDKPWLNYANLLLSGEEPIEEFARVKRVLGEFLATKTKQELLAAAVSRRLLIAPMVTLHDVIDSEHLASRGYWDNVTDGRLSASEIRVPGPFARSSIVAPPPLRLPPEAGQHQSEVLAAWRREPRAPVEACDGAHAVAPLSGVKVLDFMWVLAGPSMTRVLADYGATVVRVESATRLDPARTVGPFLGGVADPERSGVFLNINAGKLGLALNLAEESSRSVIEDLVRWADVITESFSPQVMRSLGLDYESVRAINPGIVMMSSSLLGASGPLSQFSGFGNLAAALGGFFSVTGWPDRAPCGPFSAYTDYVSPRYGAAALLAAIDHRRRTGQGQHVELAQMEACLHFLSPGLLDAAVNGRPVDRFGNLDEQAVPHGVYRCAGQDRWVAIACPTDAEWQSLCRVVDSPDLDAAAHATLEARIKGRCAIDDALTMWTSRLSVDDVMHDCIAAGVPAHAAQRSSDCAGDPQLIHRNHFVQVEHPFLGLLTIEGSRTHLARTPAVVDRAGPSMGQDVIDILSGQLGYDDDRIAGLFAAAALE